MNELIYICRSVANSENAICRLNKTVGKLAKCCRKTHAQVGGILIATLLITTVIAIQDKEIRALKKQVADLAKCEEAETHDTTEEQTAQEGA